MNSFLNILINCSGWIAYITLLFPELMIVAFNRMKLLEKKISYAKNNIRNELVIHKNVDIRKYFNTFNTMSVANDVQILDINNA